MNYFNKILLIPILVLVAGLLSSCDDQLATSPYDTISADKAYESVSDLNEGALGAYGTINGVNIYAINARMTDNLRRASSNTGQGMQVFNHNIIAGNGAVAFAWDNAYTVIDRANRVLTASKSIEGQNSEEKEMKKQIQGEMYGLRAYEHFDLYRLFASYDESGLAVPYMTESVISSPSRDPKAEFFSKLTADIDSAITLLREYGTSDNDRFNLRTAQGLRARVALYRENWSTAIEYATDAIENSSGLTPIDSYLSLWDDSNQGEVMFKLLRPTPDAGTVDIFERSDNEDVFFYASNELANLYQEDNDIRFPAFLKRLGAETVEVTKYNKREGQKNTADIKMMRVSEMYLIRAEAYARPGPQQDLAAAEADLRQLRANRYETPPPTSFSSSEAAIDAIYLERRLELAFEGHRFFDLKRANLPITRIPADIDGATTSDGLPADDHRFVFPIPQGEIFANDNIDQNPGY